MQGTILTNRLKKANFADDDKRYNILYVDDEDINLRLFKVTFKRHFNVITASNGSEALERMKENDIKLLLTDQQMPGMLGTELLEKTIGEYPDIIRIIVTGYADISAIAKAVNRCGIYKYITKPWDNGELKITMDKALESYELKNDRDNLIQELEEVNASLEQKVEERTRELTEANSRLMSGLVYAETIQKAILPKEDQILKKFKDAFVVFRPKEHVSGDFFWHATAVENDRELEIIAAIDCVGHGVAGALLTMIGENLLEKIINENKVYSSDEILSQMDQGLIRSLSNTANKGYETMDASILVIDRESSKAEFAGASQNLMLFREGELEVIKGTRLHVGGDSHSEEGFTKSSVDLNGVGSIYMQSDGYRDQLSDKGKIGIKRMKELLTKIHERPMSEQKLILEKFINQWMGDEEQTDDITVVGLKI
ncbi:MAG: response regulator [Cyclobacteriaceae bacterium]